MSPIKECIINRKIHNTPIWFMRQAGRYLPEFREIRKKNQNFIKLCLNKNLSSEITLQPLKRFELDAAIIFSDILIVPYGLGQKVEFKKNFGPLLGEQNLDKIAKTLSVMLSTHPWTVMRGSELYKWVESGHYDNILDRNKSQLYFPIDIYSE